MKCFQYGCKTIATLYCACSEEIEFCCNLHIPDHLSKPAEKHHKFFSSVKKVHSNMRDSIIGKLIESINEFKELRGSILNIFNQFNGLIIQCVKKLDEIIKDNRRMLKESLFLNQINIPISNKSPKENYLNLEMLQLCLKESFKTTNFNKIIKKSENLQNSLKLIKDQFTKPKNNTLLFYFIDNTKYLIKFNTKNYEFSKKEISDILPIGTRACVCHLKDGNLFCYGGNHQETMSSAYFINSFNFSITRLANGKPRHSARPVLLFDRIYFFGGWTDKCLNSSDYFDLNDRKWTEIAPLPSFQSDTSTIKVNSKILITGCYGFFQSFNPILNTYQDLAPDFEINFFNILLKHKKKIFILCQKVYHCNKNKLKGWMSHSIKNIFFDKNSCVPVKRNNKAYFIDCGYKIFMFDFQDFSLNIIGQGKI